jgi:hypothetical protein
VSITGSGFSPQTLTVPVGTTSLDEQFRDAADRELRRSAGAGSLL